MIQPFVWVSVATVALVAVVAGIARATDPNPIKLSSKERFGIQQLIDNARTMSKQAEQDADLTQRLTDICFGLAYVNSARLLATDLVIEDVCGVKVDELYSTLRALQQQCLTEMEK